MNILMVVDVFFPDVIGGSGRVVNEVSKRLAKRGHNVCVLTCMRDNKKLPSEEIIEGVKVYRYAIKYRNVVTFCYSSLFNLVALFGQITRKIQFDVINFHQPLSAYGVNLSRHAKQISKIYTFHSSWPEEYQLKTGLDGPGYFIRKWVERRTMESCQKIIVLSEYSKQQVMDIYGHNSSDIEVIPGGVDTSKFKPAQDKKVLKTRLNIPSDKVFLFTVRNLVPRMGLENLIKAMSIVVKENKDAILIIGGSGFLYGKLNKLVKETGLGDYIKFEGFIEEDRLPLYYQAADIFILPTKHLEGFGLVTLEALSCGTPVLGTPVGGTREILGQLDKNLLFTDTDAMAIAEKILAYLRHPDDFLEIGRKCRDFVISNYSWERMAIEYERVYMQIQSSAHTYQSDNRRFGK